MYSPRVDLAVSTALDAHGLKKRKAGKGYEASHALAVAMIVSDYGFEEDAIVGAILHDTLEDTELDRAVIGSRFGDLVLAIVEDVTEPPKGVPWRNRKEVYIEQIRRSPRDASRAVASADKIYNMSRMIEGLRSQGHSYWQPFNAPPDEMIWYQQAVLNMLQTTWRHVILNKHAGVLADFLSTARSVSANKTW